jgi:hypothetical protein
MHPEGSGHFTEEAEGSRLAQVHGTIAAVALTSKSSGGVMVYRLAGDLRVGP